MLPPADFQALFEQSPAALIVLAPDARFTIVAVTGAYLVLSLRTRESLVGQGMFEAFPEEPGSAGTEGAAALRASLERAGHAPGGRPAGGPLRPAAPRRHHVFVALLRGPELRYARAGDTRGRFDAGLLAQVALNLLDNALKYGEPGTAVELRCEGTGDALRLAVHNRGGAIPDALRTQLFQPFVQGPQTAETVKVSLGLGLYIVRENVRAHGGSVGVESSPEAGTTFTVELPRGGPAPSKGA